MKAPVPFDSWRKDQSGRAEDAASHFGYYLIKHCRDEVLRKAKSSPPPQSAEQFHAALADAVDRALHNVADLLEGFWPTSAGPDHRTEYSLAVRVRSMDRKLVEAVEISPCSVDLPIGYWAWREDYSEQASEA